MEKRQMLWKTRGMNKDLSVSAFNPEFAFENMNLRLSTNEKNTLMSWVNEKGTEELTIYSETNPQSIMNIEGIPIGTAVIDHKLVLFTTTLEDPDSVTPGTAGTDRIYVIEKKGDAWVGKELFEGNLKFDTQHLLETLVNYETEDVQKVYWVDGKNQPRVINICKDYGINPPNEYYSRFDFVSELQLNETVTIQKLYGGGRFAPGVIQYALTYYNKYGQESNIFYTTPLYYVSFIDRAGSPDEMVDNAFKITVSDLDSNYDYLRIYSIQRTSLDDVPIVKRVQDVDIRSSEMTEKTTAYLRAVLPEEDIAPQYSPFSHAVNYRGYIKGNHPDLIIKTADGNITWGSSSTDTSVLWVSVSTSPIRILETTNSNGRIVESFKYTPNKISYTDTGQSGDSVDPTELLYKGGTDIIASTIEQKDNTLFLGNLKMGEEYIGNIDVNGTLLKDAVKRSSISSLTRNLTTKEISGDSSSYAYYNQLNGENCAGFKKGNYYRLGVQFQYKTGKWSEPLFINDAIQNNHFSTSDATLTIPTFNSTLSSSIVTSVLDAGYKKARGVVVYPNPNDRVVICQGVAAPTVYTQNHRVYTDPVDYLTKGNNDLYAQSSWVFRTTVPQEGIAYDEMQTHYRNIGTTPPSYDDVSYLLKYTDNGVYSDEPEEDDTAYNPADIKRVEIQGQFNPENKFRIAWNFLTLHSPDVEFDTNIYYTDLSNVKCYQIGESTFTKTLSDINVQTESPTISNLGSGFDHKSFADKYNFGIISGLFYDDCIVDDADEFFQEYSTEKRAVKWMVYLWNKTGSLNNDINRPAGKGTPSALLKKKIISNLRYAETVWGIESQKLIQGIPQLFTDDQVSIVKVNEHIYQGNIDTVLIPDQADGQYFAFDTTDTSEIIENQKNVTTSFIDQVYWKLFDLAEVAPGPKPWKYRTTEGTWTYTNDSEIGNDYLDLALKKEFVRMKYKSTAHIPFMLDDQYDFTWSNYSLPIVEFRRTIDKSTIFGGQSDDALKANTWIPCGEPQTLVRNTDTNISYSYGDTYYQRWDCLKTYAFTPEDENQVVEIGSFMLETYTNIEGRYDRNRGQKSNINMSPINFNLLNPVYSQRDNFFNYKIVSDANSETVYPNQITWSLTKTTGADVDLWTNVNMGSALELDGDKGEITKVIRLNDKLLAFQESGISQIMYNENVQISTEQGVPIEIANSGKVQGARYLSNTIGCSNKWSMAQTPAGIYFMDSNDKSIYLLGEGLKNVTLEKGFNTWAKQEIKNNSSNSNYSSYSTGGFRAFYDKLNREVLFINQDRALAWSEKLGAFTSFYSYGGAPYFINLDDEGLWINRSNKSDEVNGPFKLWEHQGGDYGKFFDVNEPYWTVLVGNPDSQMDKTFTNLEFRANVDGDTILPFDDLEVWNEYQHGKTALEARNGQASTKHYTNDGISGLNRKFRIWRCDIPRDNLNNHPLNRMRNPWIYLKMMKKAAEPSSTLDRCEVHDMIMSYFL